MPRTTAPPRTATLPLDLAVLCGCGGTIPLALFVLGGTPARQVRCASCGRDLVLADAW
jgi:hypothetical protein